MGNSKPLILVVDDEAHILHVVSLKLRNAGYEVITAQNGEEGLDAALQNAPSLIITDYQMPVMSGLEMCQRIKEDQQLGATPAMMLTARGFSLGDEELATTNIAEVLSKPFSPREVLERVRHLIEQGSTAKEVNAN